MGFKPVTSRVSGYIKHKDANAGATLRVWWVILVIKQENLSSYWTSACRIIRKSLKRTNTGDLCWPIIFLSLHYPQEDFFSSCKKTDPRFDNCIRDALNSVRPYFKTGLPQYGVKPFDPFYAETVPQVVNGQFLSYRLMLRNVTESGWTQSQVTRFRSDFNKDLIEYTQFFPDKRLKGRFDFNGDLLGMRMKTSGVWSLALFDFTQTTTVTRKPRMVNGEKVYDTPMKVNVNVQTCRHMELHISNLLGGRTLMENMLDRIINSAWPPGFLLLRPVINDLVSTGFTDIFNDDFRNFPFSDIIK